MAMADELAKSPYLYLFKDENFKRWYQNVKNAEAQTLHTNGFEGRERSTSGSMSCQKTL
jgi:hypothetical protein